MQPGLLKHKVIIKSETTSTNSYNETIRTWADFLTVWCSFKPITADKRFTADREVSYRAGVFETYYIAGITNEMRLQHDGVLWNITGVSEIGFREGLQITAEVRSSDANTE